MILADEFRPSLMLMRADSPANLAVEDRGEAATLSNCADPAAALDLIFASLYCERSTDDRLN